jgi:hypothetical protein
MSGSDPFAPWSLSAVHVALFLVLVVHLARFVYDQLHGALHGGRHAPLAPPRTMRVHKEDCMEDKHKELRELPFDALAGALGVDFTRFRTTGTEWTGPCPVHRPRRKSSSFRYANDGRWNCLSCGAKGKGAIDLAMGVKAVGFQSAVEILQAVKILDTLPARHPANLHHSLEVFGATQLKNCERHRIVYLVESPFAVTKFHQMGLPAVSCFGWTISPQQADIIRSLAEGVVFLPHRDKRKEAAQYAGLLSESCWVRMPEFETEDPESLSPEQIKALA